MHFLRAIEMCVYMHSVPRSSFALRQPLQSIMSNGCVNKILVKTVLRLLEASVPFEKLGHLQEVASENQRRRQR